MPSFRLPFSIWKIPAWKVFRTQPPCWLGFVWLRLRREKWKRCVRTYGCWVKLLLQSWMGSSPAAPRVPSQVSRGGLFVSSEVTFSHKAGTLYRHVCSMLTRVIDWREAGRHHRCSTRHSTTEQWPIMKIIFVLVKRMKVRVVMKQVASDSFPPQAILSRKSSGEEKTEGRLRWNIWS